MRYLRFPSMAIALILSLSLGCNYDKKHWGFAESSNTVRGYQTYLNTHPKGRYADAALVKIAELTYFKWAKYEDRIPVYNAFLETFPKGASSDSIRSRLVQLYDTRRPETRDARTAKIICDLDFESLNDSPHRFESIARTILENAGMKLLGKADGGPDITLDIEVRGRALSASYLSGTFYSGAQVAGTVAVRTSKGLFHKEKFEGRIDPPPLITVFGHRTHNELADAPWFGALSKQGSYYDKLFDITDDLFGCHILVILLSKMDYYSLANVVRARISRIRDPVTIEMLRNVKDHYNGMRAVFPDLDILTDFKYSKLALSEVAKTVMYLDSFVQGHNDMLFEYTGYILEDLKKPPK